MEFGGTDSHSIRGVHQFFDRVVGRPEDGADACHTKEGLGADAEGVDIQRT